jgi:hypothetical protein
MQGIRSKIEGMRINLRFVGLLITAVPFAAILHSLKLI